ncbi:MAG: glycosyltransferase family 4 protein [Pseudomonadota bacterium]
MAPKQMISGPVLLISVDAFPKMGGISTMTHHLANAFAELPGGAILLAPAGCHVPAAFTRRYALAEDFESDLEARDGTAGLAEDARIEALIRTIITEERPRRILLIHAFHYGPGAVAAARAHAIPVSVFIHGTEFTSQTLRPADALRTRRDPASRGFRLLSTLAAADEILTNSRHTANLVAAHASGRPPHVAGVGLPLATLRAEQRNSPVFDRGQRLARRRALGLSDGPLLGYIGRLTPNKRIDRMLEIAAHIPSATCLIGGTGPAEQSLRAHAKSLGLSGRIHFTGALSEDAKWRALRAMDFSFLLSEHDTQTGAYEGFGIAMLEAAAAGAVPVSTGVDGMADFAGAPWHGALRLAADPWQPEHHAKTLRALHAEEAGMDALVRRGRHAIANAFTWERIARTLDYRWHGQPMELARAG